VAPSEHDVELGVAEDEGVAAVDERDVDVAGHFLGQPCGQLQSGEAGTEDQHAGHGSPFSLR